MPRTRFCSACGEPIRKQRAAFPVFGLLCARCSPRFRRERALVIAAFCLCLAAGFAIARYTAPREPFYFIGTPVELNANKVAPPTGGLPRTEANGPVFRAEQEKTSADSPRPESICGAPTKSGRPCQRKVKDGGYCWQHRDKFGGIKRAPDQR
ncbi:MAG: hypothetical protein AABO41_18020 [Acidobacteriota bacterium]